MKQLWFLKIYYYSFPDVYLPESLLHLLHITAYYMHNSVITDEIEDNIVFADIPKAKLLWKHPKTFLTALEMQYALLYWHFSNSQKKSLKANLKRGRIILISIVILFFILLFASLFGSFNIQLQSKC